MSTATEISRLQTARNTIRNKMVALGLGESTDLLDDLADEIDGIANNGAVSATVQEGESYTIAAGYHNGSGTVVGVAGGGNYTLQSKGPITPTKSSQSITADNGYYGLSGVSIAAIPEAYQDVSSVTAGAGDVLATKTIVTSDGTVTAGTMTNNGAVSKTLDATTSNQSYTVPAGYHNGSGTVQIVLETKSATPGATSQDITPTSGKVLSKVTVGAVPAKYGDTTNDDAAAGDLLYGKVAHSYDSQTGEAVEITGSMTNNGAVSQTLTTSTTSYTVPAGYHNGSGTVSITTETKSATPATTSQDITPSTGKVLSKVTVGAIPAKYGDTTGDDAVAGDILYGKKAHSISSGSAVAVTGSMANNGAVSKTLDATTNNQSYTVPAGYHNGSGTVSIILETKGTTPTTSSQTITPTSGKVLSSVTVAAIPSAYQDVSNVDATAGDVLEGKTIVIADGTEVTGTMVDRGTVTQTLDATTGKQSYTIPAGKHSGSGTVSITLEEKSATPATTSQNITPTSGKVLSKVTVNAIPAKFGDTTGDTATAAYVLAGYKAHTISSGSAVQITGEMANNGAISATIDGLTTTSYTVSAGYTSGGSVSLTSDIEDALALI